LRFERGAWVHDARPGGDDGFHADVLQFTHFARRRDALGAGCLYQIVDVFPADARAGVGHDDGIELDRRALGFLFVLAGSAFRDEFFEH
jgi:hypothetical protein